MENRNSRVLQSLKVGWLETARLDLPGPQFREVQCQQAQHVDHRGTANQIYGESGILRVALGKEGEAPAINHRGAEGERRGLQYGTSGNHTCCQRVSASLPAQGLPDVRCCLEDVS